LVNATGKVKQKRAENSFLLQRAQRKAAAHVDPQMSYRQATSRIIRYNPTGCPMPADTHTHTHTHIYMQTYTLASNF
jgi:hypothetical protein